MLCVLGKCPDLPDQPNPALHDFDGPPLLTARALSPPPVFPYPFLSSVVHATPSKEENDDGDVSTDWDSFDGVDLDEELNDLREKACRLTARVDRQIRELEDAHQTIERLKFDLDRESLKRTEATVQLQLELQISASLRMMVEAKENELSQYEKGTRISSLEKENFDLHVRVAELEKAHRTDRDYMSHIGLQLVQARETVLKQGNVEQRRLPRKTRRSRRKSVPTLLESIPEEVSSPDDHLSLEPFVEESAPESFDDLEKIGSSDSFGQHPIERTIAKRPRMRDTEKTRGDTI